MVACPSRANCLIFSPNRLVKIFGPISIYKIKERYSKLALSSSAIIAATRKEPQCPYRLMNILFSDRFAESFAQFGNVVDDGNPTINYFLGWSAKFKGQDEAYDNVHFADGRFSVTFTTLTLAELSLIAGKNSVQCGRV